MQPVSRVLAALVEKGLLLKQDKTLPSVVGILTGESLRTSWWSHPKARLIFSVLSELADHPDVLFTKLLHRKDTLVHRSLWPAVLAVGRGRERWQLQGLSSEAGRLLARRLVAAGGLQGDAFRRARPESPGAGRGRAGRARRGAPLAESGRRESKW